MKHIGAASDFIDRFILGLSIVWTCVFILTPPHDVCFTHLDVELYVALGVLDALFLELLETS